MENNFEKMMKPNPKGHYMGEPKEIEVEVLKVSEHEIIEKVDYPGGGFRYSHQYLENDVWKLCRHCGDRAGIPELSRGGGQHSVEHIQKYCSKYGTY